MSETDKIQSGGSLGHRLCVILSVAKDLVFKPSNKRDSSLPAQNDRQNGPSTQTPGTAPSHFREYLKKRWVQTTIAVLIGAAGVYTAIYLDVVSRAKESYMEAEKYMNWQLRPEQKKAYLEKWFSDEKAGLEIKLKKKKISVDEFNEKIDVLRFDLQFRQSESSLKYAYQWYKDTYELFSPPESKWVKMARLKTPEALELWKKELREKKIPFEDYMFE